MKYTSNEDIVSHLESKQNQRDNLRQPEPGLTSILSTPLNSRVGHKFRASAPPCTGPWQSIRPGSTPRAGNRHEYATIRLDKQAIRLLASEELDVVTPLEEIDDMINEILRVLTSDTAG